MNHLLKQSCKLNSKTLSCSCATFSNLGMDTSRSKLPSAVSAWRWSSFTKSLWLSLPPSSVSVASVWYFSPLTALYYFLTTIGKYIFGIILINFSTYHYTRQYFNVYLQFSHHKYSNNLQLVSLGFCRLHRKLDCQDTLTSEGPNIYCPIQLCNTKRLFQQIHPQYLECHF